MMRINIEHIGVMYESLDLCSGNWKSIDVCIVMCGVKFYEV